MANILSKSYKDTTGLGSILTAPGKLLSSLLGMGTTRRRKKRRTARSRKYPLTKAQMRKVSRAGKAVVSKKTLSGLRRRKGSTGNRPLKLIAPAGYIPGAPLPLRKASRFMQYIGPGQQRKGLRSSNGTVMLLR